MLCGCTSTAAPPRTVSSQAVLVTADWEPPGTFDPAQASTVTRRRLDTLLFRRLWLEAPSGRLVPDLAESVPAARGSDLEVKLRPGLRWSDGAPITAEDVAFSFEAPVRVLSPTSLVLKTDPRTAAGVFIVPEHRLRAADRAAFFAAPDVVSGPFKLAARDPDRLVFERNPRYGGRPAYIARIVELLLASHSALLAAAEAGEVDLLPHLGPADVGVSIGGLRTIVTASRREEVLVPAGLSSRVISGLSLATDRSALIPGARALGPGRNLALARLLLAGSSPEVTVSVPCNDAVRAEEASTLSAQWARAGVATDVSCGAALASGVALTAYPRPAPRSDVPLVLWPDVRAVSPRLHGFAADDASATDYWNAADWWLA